MEKKKVLSIPTYKLWNGMGSLLFILIYFMVTDLFLPVYK